MEHSKWLAVGRQRLRHASSINTVVNWFGKRFGTGRISLSKRIKDSVKGAVKHINDFEGTVTDIAMQSGYRYVVCGHIHQPALKHVYSNDGRSVFYLNSGDWVENLSALEYQDGTRGESTSTPTILLHRKPRTSIRRLPWTWPRWTTRAACCSPPCVRSSR
ncbi:MAG: hypothetical protein IPO87_05525 [Flavobacteriales bacterium]|nr:hypothetical protein [Flavobacteriales bacterium]